MNLRKQAAIAALVLGLVGLAVVAVFAPYNLLKDASDTFRDDLKTAGYPVATITDTRVDAGAGRSSKGYDARVQVGDSCLLRLQMAQPGIFGDSFSLLEVNGRSLELDGSPTYGQALAYAASHGYPGCKR